MFTIEDVPQRTLSGIEALKEALVREGINYNCLAGTNNIWVNDPKDFKRASDIYAELLKQGYVF